MITKSLWITDGKGSEFPFVCLIKTKSLCAILHWGYSSMNMGIEREMFAVAWSSEGWMKECWNFTSHRSRIQDEDLVAGCVVVSALEMASHLHTGPALQNTSVTPTNQGILMIYAVTKWKLMIKNTYLFPYRTWSSNWYITVVIQTLLCNWFSYPAYSVL